MSQRYASRDVALLKLHDYGRWMESSVSEPRAGMLGPYGVQHLGDHGFRLAYSDRVQRPPWSGRFVQRVASAVVWRRPDLAGTLNAALSISELRRADVTLAIFEDQGLGLAALKARCGRRSGGIKLAVIACWLAETCRSYDYSTLRRVRRALSSVELVFYFSSNQADALTGTLGLPEARIRHVQFGIDAEFFRPLEKAEEDYVCAIGRDHARDYNTLIEAVRGTSIRLWLVCGPHNVAGITLPSNVEILTQLTHSQYRELMGRAKAVIVPTTAPAYPSGQTVVLEAMAMGKICITTASPAIADYVDDGITGHLTPPFDVDRLRDQIRAVRASNYDRCAMGARARESVEQRFTQATMWASIAKELRVIAS